VKLEVSLCGPRHSQDSYMAGKRKKPAFVTHKAADALRRRSKSPPTVKRRHLNFSYKNVGKVGISETSSVMKEDVKLATETGASDWLNQSESDPAYQEFLAGVMTDEPSIVKARQTEVGACCNAF
jgi:hypothetical protein